MLMLESLSYYYCEVMRTVYDVVDLYLIAHLSSQE